MISSLQEGHTSGMISLLEGLRVSSDTHQLQSLVESVQREKRGRGVKKREQGQPPKAPQFLPSSALFLPLPLGLLTCCTASLWLQQWVPRGPRQEAWK